jgi:phenylacetate-CoA ligase
VCANFKPNVIFGVPGVLVRLAKHCQENNLNIKIDKFFYAGEALLKNQKEVLEAVFGIKSFYSAGYACVDTGIIGYQDSTCDAGEHLLFPNIAHLEISSKGCFITSLLREDNPVLNYELQDKLVWVDKDNGKFKLLGRCDSLIQIWGARISFSNLDLDSFQILIHKDESIEIRTAGSNENLLQAFYAASSDLNQTVSYEFLISKVRIVHSDFYINKRTGKVSQIIDLRLESL